MGKASKKASPSIAVTDLADLSAAYKKVEQERARKVAAARAAYEERNREALQQARDRHFVAQELADVVPLEPPDRNLPEPVRPEPTPLQRELDEQQALASTLSDDIDVERYLDTDDELSYRAQHIGPEVVPRLRRGNWKISRQIDLHGLRRDEARETLVAFLDDCKRHNNRCVRVIHGKGLGSVNREPVLKGKVRKWLVQRLDVLAFCQAPVHDGGAGALLVLLAGSGRP